MNDRDTESGTEIAKGFPPPAPIHIGRSEPAEPDVRLNEPSVMQVFFAWEKLRLLYNGIFVAMICVLASGLRGEFRVRDLWRFLIVLLFINIFCSAGVAAECYLCYFGIPRLAARWISFVVLAVTVAFLIVVLLFQ